MPSSLNSAPSAPEHVTVCICTCKRPALLSRLLESLSRLEMTNGLTYSVLVVDNDPLGTARDVVKAFGAVSLTVQYFHEPEQNIARARNRAIENATGDLIAFIDDDEEPSADWLIRLVRAVHALGADGALGPVVPRYLTEPPAWLRSGRLFGRPELPTGTWLNWRQTRAGNVLLRRESVIAPESRFDERYKQVGEDVDFFRRLIANGRRFVWCAEAAVSELVPEERCRRGYFLKRALERGSAPYNQSGPAILTSVIAVPLYALSLPVLLFFGQETFMMYLIKECDHLGRLLAFLQLRLTAKPVMADKFSTKGR